MVGAMEVVAAKSRCKMEILYREFAVAVQAIGVCRLSLFEAVQGGPDLEVATRAICEGLGIIWRIPTGGQLWGSTRT